LIKIVLKLIKAMDCIMESLSVLIPALHPIREIKDVIESVIN